MATTVLECDEFVAVLLDTEGINAVGASETSVMSLLTLTTLLSSFLIYNSKKVPQKVDLDKMRCFSQLSTSLLSQCGESMSEEARKSFFPRFLWLLRDVSLKMTDRSGKELEPTEYLHTRLLSAESGELTELGKSLVSLFPLLECAKLPIPSIKKGIICNIVERQGDLKPAFNEAVDALIQQILQQVTPKKAVDGTTTVNGKALAALAGEYVEAVNKPGSVPDLDQGWQAVVRLELKQCSDKLVREYQDEMERAVDGNLPMEERNLLRIHQQTLKRIKIGLREEVWRVDPLHSSYKEVQPLLDQLEQNIVQWKVPSSSSDITCSSINSSSSSSSNGEREVVGGVLYQFTIENFKASKEHCERLLTDLVKENKVQEKLLEALRNSLPIDIQLEASKIAEAYSSQAVGPAASQVLERGLEELSQFTTILKEIPGPPQNVEVVGKGSDRIKLSWDPPLENPEAVEEYVVYKRIEGGEWEEAVRTEKTRALVKGLKSQTKYRFEGIKMNDPPIDIEETASYEFQVVATNSMVTSLETKQSSETEVTTAAIATYSSAAGAVGALFLPYVIGSAQEAFKEGQDFAVDHFEMSDSKQKFLIGLSIAALPVSIALAPVTMPALAITTAMWAKHRVEEEQGDLTED